MGKARMYGYWKPVKKQINQLRWAPKTLKNGEIQNDRDGRNAHIGGPKKGSRKFKEESGL